MEASALKNEIEIPMGLSMSCHLNALSMLLNIKAADIIIRYGVLPVENPTSAFPINLVGIRLFMIYKTRNRAMRPVK